MFYAPFKLSGTLSVPLLDSQRTTWGTPGLQLKTLEDSVSVPPPSPPSLPPYHQHFFFLAFTPSNILPLKKETLKTPRGTGEDGGGGVITVSYIYSPLSPPPPPPRGLISRWPLSKPLAPFFLPRG